MFERLKVPKKEIFDNFPISEIKYDTLDIRERYDGLLISVDVTADVKLTVNIDGKFIDAQRPYINCSYRYFLIPLFKKDLFCKLYTENGLPLHISKDSL